MSKDLFFPLDVITDILPKLSVKSLLRFKCVSKSWLSSISNAEFAKLHLKQVIQNKTVEPRLLLSNFESLRIVESQVVGDDYITTLERDRPIDLCFVPSLRFQFLRIGSCNGLIACCGHSAGTYFVVFNPNTRQFRNNIPDLPPVSSSRTLLGNGFGYDAHIDDYKIVTVRFLWNPQYYDSSLSMARVDIFNLKSNSWRTVQERKCSYSFEGEGVSVNGILHWVMRKGTLIGTKGRELDRFGLVEERFLDRMILPSLIKLKNSRLKMLDERLCVYSVYESLPTNFVLWKMMDYGVEDSWTKVYQFSSDDLIPGQLNLKFVTKTGQFVFVKCWNDLIIYNPKDGKIEMKELLPPNQTRDPRRMLHSIGYVESLVSPHIN